MGGEVQGWWAVTAFTKVFIFTVCHAIRNGRPRWLPLSISGDTRRPSRPRDGLMETFPPPAVASFFCFFFLVWEG